MTENQKLALEDLFGRVLTTAEVEQVRQAQPTELGIRVDRCYSSV
jgi:hypothetical protein